MTGNRPLMSNQTGKGGSKSGGKGFARDLTVRVKTAKGRKLSSTRWLQRQLNDPYVIAAKKEGYRSRAAYKLIEIDDKYKLINPGQLIVDLGAAPGGWSQVAARRSNAETGKGEVLALDLVEMPPIPGVRNLTSDFMEDEGLEQLAQALDHRQVDLVLSDMAAPATGHKQTDHLRIIALCECAYQFAVTVLAPGGAFICKVLQGGADKNLLIALKQDFSNVRHVKPKASRSDSSEQYVLAMGFRGQTSGYPEQKKFENSKK